MVADAIFADALAKCYRIDSARDKYGRLTESLWKAMTGPFRGSHRGDTIDVWALRDVSFAVPVGSAVGIIGRNGAGKSTLLKVLSRITAPTSGRARVRGRVGTLLEVGTGFHPELTGRENVQLSGAILGMRRTDIARHFDDIVEFAGIGSYIDTPVKRYSSGMRVRLGFAVAAFLEPEVLLVDEVLAVGDAEFQKRSLGKLTEIGQEGRTVLFVSHSMPAVLRLCTRAILLDSGRTIADGASAEVVRRYLESDLGRTAERTWPDEASGPGDSVARLRRVRVIPPDGGTAEEVDIRQPVDIEVEYETVSPGPLRPFVNLHFFNDDGVCLFITGDMVNQSWWNTPRRPGIVRASVRIPGNFLAEGRIVVTAAVSTINPTVVHAIERDAIAFQIVDRSAGDGARGEFAQELPGVVRPKFDWTVEHT